VAPTPDSAAASAEAAAARVEQASDSFDRALGLEEKGDLAAALLEYERAFQLLPNYDVLYNIGSVNLELARLAPARRAFEQYLKLGGPSISSEQAAAVRHTIEELKQRTATLSLALNVAPSEVSIDSMPLETLDFSGVVLDAGEHVIRVQKPGFVPLEKSVSLARGDRLQLIVQLLPLEAAAVRSQPEGAPIPVPLLAEQSPFRALPPEPQRLWIPWTITGVLAAGWATTAALAIQAQGDREVIEQRNASDERIRDARRVHVALAVVSDVLLVSTLAAAGVSSYLTWWPSVSLPDAQASSGALPGAAQRGSPGLWSANVSGTF
jgi:PEGA domain-containing protein